MPLFARPSRIEFSSTVNFEKSPPREQRANVGKWASRYFAKGQARYSHKGGLFLNAAGIGDHYGRSALHRQKLKIWEWIKKIQITNVYAHLLDTHPCAWMNGKHYG